MKFSFKTQIVLVFSFLFAFSSIAASPFYFNPSNLQTGETSHSANSITFTIAGQVTDGNGKGVEGVTVYATQSPWLTFLPAVTKGSPNLSTPQFTTRNRASTSLFANPQQFTVITDENGFYIFTDLPKSPYSLHVVKDNIQFEPDIRRISPPDSSSQNFQIKILSPIIKTETEIISQEMNQHLESISADGARYTFASSTPDINELNIGDVMVSNRTTQSPNGYLRKITGRTEENNRIILDTIPATIEQAVEDGTVYLSNQFGPGDVASIQSRSGVVLKSPGLNGLTFSFSVNDVVLYDVDGNLLTENDQITANGAIEFELNTEFFLNIENGQVKNLTFAQRSTLQDRIEISSSISSAELEKEVVINSMTMTPITAFVGPMPVVIVPKLDLIIGMDGSVNLGISTSVSHAASLRAGVKYVNPAGWHPIANFTNDLTFTPPKVTLTAKVNGYYGVRLNMFLYGVAGPYVKITPYLELTVQPGAAPWWELAGGISVPAGFRATDALQKVLELEDFELITINQREILAQAQGQNHPPEVPNTPFPDNHAITANLTPKLLWTSPDPDGDEVNYDIYFEANDPTPDVLIAEKIPSSEYPLNGLAYNTTYYWQINATDSYGWSNAGPVWQFTTPVAPPLAFGKTSPANGAVNQLFSIPLSWTESAGATSYAICIDSTNDNNCSNWVDLGLSSQVTLDNLAANTTYYWQVRSSNQGGDTYADNTPTSYWSFRTMADGGPFRFQWPGIDHFYQGIPFQIETSMQTGNFESRLCVLPSRNLNSVSVPYYQAHRVHILQYASNSITIPDGSMAARVVVHYTDGTSDSSILMFGDNTAEWSYDRPENTVVHSHIQPAYSFWTNLHSGSFYWAHIFYASVETNPNKSINQIELIREQAGKFDIAAITYECAVCGPLPYQLPSNALFTQPGP